MDEPGIRKQHVQQPDEIVVRQQLVGDARRPGRQRRQLRQIAIGDQPVLRGIHALHDLRILRQAGKAATQHVQLARELLDLSGAERIGMIGQDLFDQRRARARHADDEDRHRCAAALEGPAGEEVRVEHLADRIEEAEGLGLVIVQLGPLETPPVLKCRKALS